MKLNVRDFAFVSSCEMNAHIRAGAIIIMCKHDVIVQVAADLRGGGGGVLFIFLVCGWPNNRSSLKARS